MKTCPCCSHPMLRHVRHHQIYWFCRSCWQEMPILAYDSPRSPLSQLGELATVQ